MIRMARGRWSSIRLKYVHYGLLFVLRDANANGEPKQVRAKRLWPFWGGWGARSHSGDPPGNRAVAGSFLACRGNAGS